MLPNRQLVPPLPQMAAPTLRSIDALGIAHVQRPEDLSQAIVRCGYGDEMNVVGHQAVGDNFHPVLLAILRQPAEVGLAVVV